MEKDRAKESDGWKVKGEKCAHLGANYGAELIMGSEKETDYYGSMKRIVSPQIFDYTDYRKFLTDLFSWEKGKRPRFSLRSFCAKVSPGLAASSFLSAVLRGKKNIGPSLRARFAHALGLKVREGKYFDLLVQFNQAKDIREKSALFAQLSRFNHTRARIVYENQFRFFTQWYHPAHFQPALTVELWQRWPELAAG